MSPPQCPQPAQLPQGNSLASYTVLHTIPCSRLLDQGRQGSPECGMSSTGAGSLLVWAERPWWWGWGRCSERVAQGRVARLAACLSQIPDPYQAVCGFRKTA